MQRPRALLVSALALGLLSGACSFVLELPSSSVEIPLVDGGNARFADVAELDAFEYVDPDAEPLPPTPPFCATQGPSLFCADFDEGTASPTLADLGTVTTSGGDLQVVNAIALSPPRSLVASTTGSGSSSFFVPTFERPPEQITAGANILLSTFTTTAAEFMQIELAPEDDAGTTRCSARLSAGSTWAVTQVCTDGGAETGRQVSDSGRPVERREWRRFVLRLTAQKTFTLHIDDTLVVNVSPLDPSTLKPSSVTYGIAHPADGAVAAFYDNLLVTNP